VNPSFPRILTIANSLEVELPPLASPSERGTDSPTHLVLDMKQVRRVVCVESFLGVR
jgi:hypothetical protein